MSEIFNFFLVNNNSIEHIYIFKGGINSLTNQNILGSKGRELIDKEILNILNNDNAPPFTLINANIHKDDSIIRIKEKLVKYTNINISTAELYLFTLKNKLIDLNNLYNELTQNEYLPLTLVRLDNFIKNLNKNLFLNFKVYPNLNLQSKGIYMFNDLKNINMDLSKKHILKIPLGQRIEYLNKNYPFVVNPFDNENVDSFVNDNIGKVITENNKLLMSYGNIINNTIYFTKADDVSIIENASYKLRMYYPNLIKKNITSNDQLIGKKSSLLEEDRIRLELLDDIEKKVNFLKFLSNKFSGNLDIIEYGINGISFTLLPTKKISISLETIFKTFNTSTTIPLVKYNPGKNSENLYRLYTSDYISNDGYKIPSLYIEYNNDKKNNSKIDIIANSLSKIKSIGCFIKWNYEEIFCEIYEDGSIIIKSDLIKLATEEEINVMFKEVLNNNIISVLNENIEKYGYKYNGFESLKNENVEINSINLSYLIPYSKNVDLSKYTGCLKNIFTVYTDKINENNDSIQMIYKKVSYYKKMNDMDTFITVLYKNKIPITEIVSKLKNTFSISIEQAQQTFSNWFSQINQELQLYENKKIKVRDNPGFKISISRIVKEVDEKGFKTLLKLDVDNVDNINYLVFLNEYIEALLLLITGKTPINAKAINIRCGEEEEKKEEIYVEDTGNKINKSKMVEIYRGDKLNAELSEEEDDDLFFQTDDEDDEDDERSGESKSKFKKNTKTPQTSPEKEPTPPPSPEKEPTPPPSPEKEPTPPPSPEKEPTPPPSPEKEHTPPPSPEKEPTPQPSPEKEPTPQPSPEKEPTPQPSPEKEPTPNNSLPSVGEEDYDADSSIEIDSKSAKSINLDNDEDVDISIDDLLLEEEEEEEPYEKSKSVDVEESVTELPNFDSSEKKQDNTGFTMGQLSSDSSADSSMDGGEKVNLSNVSLSGQKNYFLNRLKKRQPKIFSTNKSGNFKNFQSSCPWQYKKFPVIINQEEKKYIDEKDSRNSSKSYDEYITYGEDDKKKYHYICPRFWCFSDEEGKSRSLTLEQVNEGECGGWDAVIPENAKKVTKGKRIFEFNNKRFNRQGRNISSKENPLVYKKYYPSYQDPSKHPKKLCVPCCFTSPTEEVKDNTEKFAWKPEPLPTFTRDPETKKIDLETVDGIKEVRPNVRKDNKILKEKCNQEEELFESKSKSKMKESKLEKNQQLLEDKPLYESFPLKFFQTGYLTQVLQKFLNYDTTICFKNNSKYLRDDMDEEGKENYCLLRIGVDKNPQTSFLSCIAAIYEDIVGNTFNKVDNGTKLKNIKKNKIEKIRRLITTKKILSITLDQFITLQNGSLIDIFSSNSYNNEDINKYKDQKIYKKSKGKTNWKTYMKYIIRSYRNYKIYLAKTKCSNYEYVWDLICSPKNENGVLFDRGINLIILKREFDSMLDKISVICPKSIYSKNVFYDERPTILLYTQNNVFEIITLQKLLKNKKLIIKKYFELNTLSRYSPVLLKRINVIKRLLNNECNIKPGLPNVYNYYENKYLNDIITLLNNYGVEVIKQLINHNTQVIGLIINFENKIFIPVKPSKINKNLDYDFFEESNNGISFQQTVNIYEKLMVLTEGKLYLSFRSLIIEDNMVVGIITETNQFVPVNPIRYDETTMNPDNKYDIINTGNEYILDEEILTNTEEDNERKRMVKKVELESNFYMAFRNTLKILLNKKENDYIKNELTSMLKINEPYVPKLNKIVLKLKTIMRDNVVFSNFKNNTIYEIEKIFNCIGLNREQCSKTNNQCLFDNNSCELIIPRKNLLSNEDNVNIYYFRLADELIRYPKVKEYIMYSEKFMIIGETNYNLKNSEILLIEENLFGEYLRNLTVRKISKYIKFNSNYDYAIPRQKNIYNVLKSNKKLLKKYSKDIVGEKQELANLSKNEVNQTIVENDNLEIISRCIKFDGSNIAIERYAAIASLYNKKYDVVEIKKQHNCTIDLMSYIISISENTTITSSDVRNIVAGLIRDYILEDKLKNEKQIRFAYKLANKDDIVRLFMNGSKVEDIVNLAEYYFTELEIILLALKFNIGIMLVSNKLSFTTKNIVKVNSDSDKIIVLIMDDYGILKVKDNILNDVPIYGLLKKHNMIFLNKEEILNDSNIEQEKMIVINNTDDFFRNCSEHFSKIKKLQTAFRKSKQKSILKTRKGGVKVRKSKNRIIIK